MENQVEVMTYAQLKEIKALEANRSDYRRYKDLY